MEDLKFWGSSARSVKWKPRLAKFNFHEGQKAEGPGVSAAEINGEGVGESQESAREKALGKLWETVLVPWTVKSFQGVEFANCLSFKMAWRGLFQWSG